MANLTLRNVKGAPLTNAEVDGNFIALNDAITTLAAQQGRFPLSVVSTDTTASAFNTYWVTASVTITLPATPTEDDAIIFVAKSECTIDPGTNNINGINDVLFVDNAPVAFTLQYTTELGWAVI